MVFKRNEYVNRRLQSAEPALSPRFARLVRESWWFLVVAAFLYLSLILATYSKTDPGWSFSGTGAPLQNRGGVIGAWLADLLLYLFGMSAWWWVMGGVVLVIAGYRRVVRPENESDHPFFLGAIGFALVLFSSAALEAIRMWKLPATLPLAPGGALGEAIGRSLSGGIGFNGATLLLLALFAVGSSLRFVISWFRMMERIGGGIETLVSWIRRRREAAVDRKIGDEATFEREQLVSQLREEEEERAPVVVVPAAAYVPKSERVVKEKQRPLFTDMPASPLPPLALLEDAPSSQEAVSNETLEYTSRLIERKLADFGVSAK